MIIIWLRYVDSNKIDFYLSCTVCSFRQERDIIWSKLLPSKQMSQWCCKPYVWKTVSQQQFRKPTNKDIRLKGHRLLFNLACKWTKNKEMWKITGYWIKSLLGVKHVKSVPVIRTYQLNVTMYVGVCLCVCLWIVVVIVVAQIVCLSLSGLMKDNLSKRLHWM